MAHILVAEDDEAQRQTLCYNLKADGHSVADYAHGEDANAYLCGNRADLAILDWMLPGLSGPEICRRLRARSAQIPVIIVSARQTEEDRLSGLAAGADDYLVKPHSQKELLIRVSRLLARWKDGENASHSGRHHGSRKFADIEIDHVTHRVFRAGKEVQISLTAFRILECLIDIPGRVLTREQLIDRIWGPQFYLEPRTIDVHMGRLRKALKRCGQADPIRTVRGIGYALNERVMSD